MSLDIATPLGIMADSHGNNEFLLEAILTLKGLGADRLIHLGDICDSRAPIGLIRQALDILSRHGVQAVRGNNECVLLHNAQSSRHKDDRAEIIPLLEALPYTIRMGDLWFTHSAPLDFPAATKRPISEVLLQIADSRAFPFRVLFRGHSHQPSIMEIQEKPVRERAFCPDEDVVLDSSSRYIVTAGAVENGSCMLFEPQEHSVRLIVLTG
jgi:predicted phosphodiesterase